MKKRLLWNFEIEMAPLLQLPTVSARWQDGICWECRYFFDDAEIITLWGLDERHLEFSRYPIRHKEDTYYLLPNTLHNLKIRNDTLFYKPLLMKKDHILGFGKKIVLDGSSKNILHPDITVEDLQPLMEQVHHEGKTITVVKEAIKYRLGTRPETKLELSWLHINHKAYFSVCIESKTYDFVKSISQQLLRKAKACDYVSFLKRALP